MKTIHTYRRAIVFLVIVQYCLAVAYASDEAGCSHNGTMFANGSLVPSMEPCLSCKCVDSHLKCSLRVCPEQPVPPPRGCVLVHKRLSCCPHVSCKRYHNENENPNRRVITYNSNWYNDDANDGDVEERRKTLSKNSLYRRIEDEDIDGNDQMCVHNGTIYRTGSAMSTSSLCSYCYCIGGKQKCVRPKCLITSPGCEPVFIDSSCCPIRYDCGAATPGVSTTLKPKGSYYRIENKHYNRMRSRAQRNRGCLVASTYYAEGEKLPSESEKPCDICFCIRGERKCTPKKCAPYIGNCKPKIPEGQCCPANYECDHSDEEPFGSSHKPRQFDLFSYFFSDETTENETTNKEPSEAQPFPDVDDGLASVSSTSEKSFFDAIRDGLNYIDSNDGHVEKILDSTSVNATSVTDRPLVKNTTGLSFLDILLSDSDNDDDDDDEHDEDDYSKGPIIEMPLLYTGADNATVFVSNLPDGELNNDRYALLDEESTHEATKPTVVVHSVQASDHPPSVQVSNYDRSATERIINEYITYTLPNHVIETSTVSTSHDFETSTLTEPTTQELTTQEPTTVTPSKYDTISTIDEEDGNYNGWSTTTISTLDDDVVAKTTTRDIVATSTHYDRNKTAPIVTTEPSVVSTFFDKFSNLFADSMTEEHESPPFKPIPMETSTVADIVKIGGSIHVTTQSPSSPKTTSRVNPTIVTSPAYPQSTPSTEKPSTPAVVTSQTTSSHSTTTLKPITSPPAVVTVHTTTTTAKSHQTTTSMPMTTSPTATLNQTKSFIPEVVHSIITNEHPSTTIASEQPPLIDSNPSILDSDLNYDYGDQPTLPPSLPNLKIIPFLPADAVRKESVHPKLDYYSTISTSYPVLTENYENPYLTGDNLENRNADYTAFEVNESEGKDPFIANNDNPNFNSYSTGYSNDEIFGLTKTNGLPATDYGQYPSITEKPDVEPTIINKYPVYNVDYDYGSFDPEKDTHQYVPGSFEVVDGHEYSVQGRNPSFDKFATEYPERQVHSKIEFSTSNPLFGYNNKFSPPSKTEGGFLPKEPLVDDEYWDKITTKYLPDLVTEPTPKTNLTVQSIGITSDDPFKNVIRTEPPPNLISLIEDKEKRFQTIPELPDASIDHDYPSIHLSNIEKEIISITTDTTYNSSPENDVEPLTDTVGYSLHQVPIDTVDIANQTSVSAGIATKPSVKYSTEVSVSSNIESDATQEPVPKDFLGSLLGYIFKENKSSTNSQWSTEPTLIQERQTIPPFKKISSTSLSLMDILNFTKPVESSSKKVDIPQRKNNKIYELTTSAPTNDETSTPRVENLNILRDVLLATLNGPSNVDPTVHTVSHPTIDVPKPIYSGHSIHQFLNPIFAGNSELTHVTSKYSPISSDIDLQIPKLNSQIGDNKDELNNNVFGPESYQVLNDYPSISNQRPFGDNPIDYDALKEHHSDEQSPSVYSQKLNSFQSSMGMLKLAGCNIYGRMYRVGRIITELSNPCLECKCTEVGVHCTTLNC